MISSLLLLFSGRLPAGRRPPLGGALKIVKKAPKIYVVSEDPDSLLPAARPLAPPPPAICLAPERDSRRY